MKNPLSLLIVEDNPSHIADLRSILEMERPRLPITFNTHWAVNLEETMPILGLADAVMTDVFFPAARGADDQVPNGRKVVERCLAENIPVVWVTSTYHHGARTNDSHAWGRNLGVNMFDAPNACGDDEAPHKPWKQALYGVFYLLTALDEGHRIFANGCMRAVKTVGRGIRHRYTQAQFVNICRVRKSMMIRCC